jgi:hypothetical protein
MEENGNYESAADASYDRNARAMVKLQTRAFPGLNMNNEQKYRNISDKTVQLEERPGPWTHFHCPGGVKDGAQYQEPSLAAPTLCEALQTSPAPIDCPGLANGKETDIVAGYPTPAELFLTSPATTPEPTPKPTWRPNAYFYRLIADFDPNNVDLNKVGILYEYKDVYFVVLEIPYIKGGMNKFRRTYMKREEVGPYLRLEWEALPKVGDRERGYGAASAEGSWAGYSGMVQKMRMECVEATGTAANEARNYKDRYGKGMDAEMYKGLLETCIRRPVDTLYVPMAMEEAQKKKEAEELFEEFMVLED